MVNHQSSRSPGGRSMDQRDQRKVLSDLCWEPADHSKHCKSLARKLATFLLWTFYLRAGTAVPLCHSVIVSHCLLTYNVITWGRHKWSWSENPGWSCKKSRTKLNKNDEEDSESSVMDQGSSFSFIRNSASSFAPFFIVIIDFRCQPQTVLSLYTCNLW